MRVNDSSGHFKGYNRLDRVSDLVDIAGRMSPRTVIISGGDRIEDLQFVESARDHGIVDRLVLVGDERRIRASIEDVGIEVRDEDVVPARGDDEVASKTVELVEGGGIDIILKGNISTPTLNRYMLRLAVQPTVSLVSLFDAAPIADGRPMILTDAGFTTVCNFGRMADLIRNAVDVAHRVMGIEMPRVAILSANEKQIPSLPSTWIGAKLAEREWSDALVYGPLSFDLATDPESVAVKGLKDIGSALQVAGNADILVCPGIDAANILYKALTAMVKYGQASIAGITIGFTVPYIILSRVDALSTRLESIALCSIYSQRKAAQPKKTSRVGVSIHGRRVIALMLCGNTAFAALFENDRLVEEKDIYLTLSGLQAGREKQAPAGEAASEIGKALASWKKGGIDAIAAWGGASLWKVPKPSGPPAPRVDLREAEVSGELPSLRRDWSGGFLDEGLCRPVAEELARSFGLPLFFMQKPAVAFSLIDEKVSQSEESVLCSFDLVGTGEAVNQASLELARPHHDIKLVIAYMDWAPLLTAVWRGAIIDWMVPCSPGELIDAAKKNGKKPLLPGELVEALERGILEGRSCVSHAVERFAFIVSKSIGALCVSAECDIEAIVLCGALARFDALVKQLRERVSRLAPVLVFREPLALRALARAAYESMPGGRKAGREV